MLSKCANPTCFARFRFLRQGRIFNIEIKENSAENSRPLNARIEHFWLCESCARVMKVVRENGVAGTRPLYPQLTAGTPAEQPPRRWPAAEKSVGVPSQEGPHQRGTEGPSIPLGRAGLQVPRK